VIKKDKICDWIEASICNFEEQTAEKILASLLKNHKRIIYSYQGVVLGKRNLDRDDFALVEPGFIEALQDSYGPENAKKCSLCEDAFGSRINKSIDNIGKLNEDSNAAVNKWKYAWAVLTGNEESAEVFLTRTGTWSRKDFYTESRWLWEEMRNTLSDTESPWSIAYQWDSFEDAILQSYESEESLSY